MACNLLASVTGSLNASITNLLQSDYNLIYIDPNFNWAQNLQASVTGSLNASINPTLEASVSQSLDASTLIVLRAKYCNRIVAL